MLLLDVVNAAIDRRTEDPERALPTLVHVTRVDTTREVLLSETCLKPTPRQPSTLTSLQAERTADAASTRVEHVALPSPCLTERRCRVTWLETRKSVLTVPAAVRHHRVPVVG